MYPPQKKQNASSVQPKAQPSSLLFLALATVAAVGLCLTGLSCRSVSETHRVLQTEQNSPQVIIHALDTSASARESLPAYLEGLSNLPLHIDPVDTWLTVLRFDYDARELYSLPMPESDEALIAQLLPQLAVKADKDQTHLGAPFQELAERVSRCRGRCIAILSTDGHAEGTRSEEFDSVRNSVQTLARARNLVAVVVEGVEPANMAKIRAALAPLATRLRFVPAGGVNASLIADLLETGGERP